jgi:L-threonylcarbamoyladenylate synthase
MDAQPIDVIIVEKVPNEGIGVAINDKLLRASAV